MQTRLENGNQRPRVLFIGDSLIEFCNWRDRFPGVTVTNLGVAGETVEGLLRRLPAAVSQLPAQDLVLIMTGINNLAMEDYGFIKTYQKVVEELLVRHPQADIGVNSLLPVVLPWLSGDAVPRMNHLLREMAVQSGAAYLDLYPCFLDKSGRPDPARFQEDGVHLSDGGYELWAAALSRAFPILLNP